MKKLFIAITLLTLICGCMKKQDQNNEKVIGKPEIQVQDGRFTPEVMWALGKMGEKSVSPDGKQIAYTVTYYDMNENKGNAEIYLIPAEGGEASQLTTTAASEFNLVWKDNKTLLFCRDNDIPVVKDLMTGSRLLSDFATLDDLVAFASQKTLRGTPRHGIVARSLDPLKPLWFDVSNPFRARPRRS